MMMATMAMPVPMVTMVTMVTMSSAAWLRIAGQTEVPAFDLQRMAADQGSRDGAPRFAEKA